MTNTGLRTTFVALTRQNVISSTIHSITTTTTIYKSDQKLYWGKAVDKSWPTYDAGHSVQPVTSTG